MSYEETLHELTEWDSRWAAINEAYNRGVIDGKKHLETHKLNSWKGKDGLEIRRDGDNWIITEHRKDKHSQEVKTTTKNIPSGDVNDLFLLIKKLCDVEPNLRAKDLWREIIEEYELYPLDVEGFNGGSARAKYYFPYYYYPVKVLEALKVITYGGRGVITLTVNGKEVLAV